jgi:hypothetical protein
MAKPKKSQKNSKEYNELYNAWVEYSREISERIKDVTEERAREYEDLYNIWNEYAQKMTKEVSRNSPKDKRSLNEVQKAWTNYSDEFGERFVDVMGKGNGPYKDLYKIWTEYSQKMGSHLSELMNESIKEHQDLYEIWMDTFGMKEKEQKSTYHGDYMDIAQFWMGMLKEPQNTFSMSNTSGWDYQKQFKDFNELWTDAYSKMMKNVLRSSEFAQMNGNILDANLELKRQNNEMVNRYLEAMGMPTKENLDDIHYKLHELDRKISEISRTVKSQRSKRKTK